MTLETLAAFAKWVIRESCFSGCDLDGASVEDKAVALGLLIKTRYEPALHGPNDLDMEVGADWYILDPALAACGLSESGR